MPIFQLPIPLEDHNSRKTRKKDKHLGLRIDSDYIEGGILRKERPGGIIFELGLACMVRVC